MNVTAIFENIGVVQEGMRSIAVPRQMPDRPGAVALQVERGAVRFEVGEGPVVFNAAQIDIDPATGEALAIERVARVIEV